MASDKPITHEFEDAEELADFVSLMNPETIYVIQPKDDGTYVMHAYDFTWLKFVLGN